MNACGGAVFPVAVNMVAWTREVVFASEEARDVRDQTRRSSPARVELGAKAQNNLGELQATIDSGFGTRVFSSSDYYYGRRVPGVVVMQFRCR
jgi:hypothetical protein